MSIVNGPITITGTVGVKPMIKYMLSTDSISTVTAAGYLNENLTNLNAITETDSLLIRYNYVPETNAGTNSFFNVAIASNGIITLSEDVSEGNVILPVANREMAIFANTSGQIRVGDGGEHVKTAAKIESGSGSVGDQIGSFRSVVPLPNVGYFEFIAAANSVNNGVVFTHEPQDLNITVMLPKVQSNPQAFVNMVEYDGINPPIVAGNILKATTAHGIMADAGFPANRILSTSLNTPDTNANIVSFDVSVTAAALAAGGSVTLYTSSGAKQYKLITMFINEGGVNFSGGGGNRNFQITDNTTVYSLVPAGTLTTLVNKDWNNEVEFPYPVGSPIRTSTAAGASLVMKYSGGTTDYATGAVLISGIMQRVA